MQGNGKGALSWHFFLNQIPPGGGGGGGVSGGPEFSNGPGVPCQVRESVEVLRVHAPALSHQESQPRRDSLEYIRAAAASGKIGRVLWCTQSDHQEERSGGRSQVFRRLLLDLCFSFHLERGL